MRELQLIVVKKGWKQSGIIRKSVKLVDFYAFCVMYIYNNVCIFAFRITELKESL